MKRKNRILCSAALALTLSLSLTACGSGTDSVATPPESAAPTQSAQAENSVPVTLKVASQDAADSQAGRLLTQFKQDVEEKSDGSITVDLHFAGTLGSLNDMIEGVSMGTIDMATAGVGAFQSYCDNMMIFDNYFVGTPDGFVSVWNSDVGQQVLEQLREEAGIYTVGYNLCGVGHVEYWTNRDYDSIESLRNANLRTNGTKTVNLACEAIGAVGVGVSNAEQYNAFQTGMVDAMSLDAANMIDLGFLEEGMYELDIIDNYLASALVISQTAWDKLSEGQRQVIRTCAQDYSDTSGRQYEQKLADTAEALKEFHVKPCSISQEEIVRLNEMVSEKLYQYYGELCDSQVLEQAKAVLEK